MMRNNFKPVFPMLLLFIVLNGFFIASKGMLERWKADQDVLILGNLVVFGASLISFLLLRKAVNASGTQAFLRGMYGSFIIKFFVIAIAAFVYIMLAKKNVNKPALFACLALYFIYTFIETGALMKLLKEKKNA